MNKKIKGIYTALVTPFKEDLSIDYPAFNTLVEMQTAAGIHGLVIGGTTGESPTLEDDERFELVQQCLKLAKNRCPVIVGVGSNSTKITLEQVQMASKYDVQAIMVTAPWYNKPTQEGLYQHFRNLAEHSEKPILIYNNPGRSCVYMTVQTILRLAQDCPNIIGIKDADISSGRSVETLVALSKVRPDFCFMSGEDGELLPVLAAGGDGVISVVSNVAPNEVLKLYKDLLALPASESTAQYQKFIQLTALMFSSTNPIPAKTALAFKSLIAGPFFRAPMCALDDEQRQSLRHKLSDLGWL